MIISPKVKPIHFWSQKVLPLVYDNSLSYYEVVDKLVEKINEIILFINNKIEDEISSVINKYFVDITYNESTETINLDISEE